MALPIRMLSPLPCTTTKYSLSLVSLHTTRYATRTIRPVPRNSISRNTTRRFTTTRISKTTAPLPTFTNTTPPPPPPPPQKPRSLPLRILYASLLALTFTTTGFLISTLPTMSTATEILNPPSDTESLALFTPSTPFTAAIEEHIQSMPIVKEMRGRSEMVESRPHMRIAPSMRAHNLTAGTLLGEGKVSVPPLTFTEKGGKSLVSISHLGEDLCGHPGIIHGGFLSTMLDEGLAKCCFGALPNKIGMTARLEVDFRAPCRAGGYVVLKARTTGVEGRKAWVEGVIETEEGVVVAEGKALFIEPRGAGAMRGVFPTEG